MLTTIPFSGFYNSIHDNEFDRELEQMVSDSSGCHPISQRIADEIWQHVNYPFNEYAKEFCEDFAIMFKGETGLDVSLTFESMNSPKYYNFSTDRIFAEVSFADVQAMLAKVDRSILDRVTRERFTSYDGFISHYRNDWREWGSMREWDHNQVGTLVAALVEQFFPGDWEWNVIEDWNGHGIVSNWMYDGLDAEGKRLVKIADYLRSREERKYR